ncbi:tetratricopeptide repeat protein [Candidatus Villigracilis affinis]|uniref:tetratricopeptide repeat protein n=1 Tax=Candidatus Villigracilis affinis TaxID=3140682 RepID=UPI002A19106B|nr:tetratricopeptide repeat protein [Anaerolineales bacterium]
MAEDRPDDTMFQDAVEALRRGDKARAKELITLLLKADQNNPTYWIWLSAAVDNTKERIYCLQTAFKLDPENGTAKRGLILLGALAPDESIQPFPMNRPRAWEEKLLLANEKPKERGFKALAKSPITRLAFVLLIGAGLVSAVIFGLILPRRSNVRPTETNTPGPSPTFTTTPTLFGATAPPTKAVLGPTPLSYFLPQTYTPTAVYVNTPRAAQSGDQYRLALAAYAKENWDEYISNMQIIASLEPDAADVPYLIGDAYRFKGDADSALDFYNEALKINEDFGPAYLGLARARLLDNPKANVDNLFEQAIELDPDFGEVYLERARYNINNNDPEAAIVDLDRADRLIPNSPTVYMTYADAYLALDDKKSALEAAETAYSLDITNLDVYKLLGKLHIESGEYERAIEALDVYAVYETEDDQVFGMLGQAYYEMGNYEVATSNFDRAEALNKNGVRKFLVYKGLANLELNNLDKAVEDLEKAASADDTSFVINLGLLRAYYLQEKFGSAFQKAEALRSLAETDEETALMLYWHALVQEKRGEVKDAIKDWQALLKMDADVMTEKMRSDAELHLRTMVTPTNTSKPGTKTATPRTPTPRSGTVTPTPKGGTGTPTPTPK